MKSITKGFFALVVFVLAILALATSVASAQELTTVPAITGIGYLDYRGCDVLGGWGLDLAATEQAISIRVYKGPGKNRKVYDDSTQGLRPDVNRDYGLVATKDVPHRHGFHFKTPVALKTGAPEAVMMVGVTAQGEEFPLIGGEFSIACASPPGIEVYVRNERGMSLSSDGLGVYLTLYRMNEEGIADWIATTDCSRNIGCTNTNGYARFAPSDLGFELEEGGSYQVRAEAWYHHYDTQDLTYSAQYGGGYANHVLRLHEVIVGINSPSYKFLSGTASTASITICNFGIGGDYPIVGFDVVTRGPGKNSGYVERTSEYGFVLPTIGQPCYTFDWAVYVPTDLPNGQWYNFVLRFKNRNRKDEVYGENSWSAAKVAFLTAIPTGDLAMRADEKKPKGEIPLALLGIAR